MHAVPGLVCQKLAAENTICPGAAKAHLLWIAALENGAQTAAAAQEDLAGRIGAKGNELCIPCAEEQRGAKNVSQRFGDIPKQLIAIFKAKAAIDGGHAGNIQTDGAQGTILFRIEGIDGLHIGAQVGQPHELLYGSGRRIAVVEPFPFVQYIGDQGAE